MWHRVKNHTFRLLQTLNKSVSGTASILVLSTALLQGCGGAILLGGITAGTSVVHDRRDSDIVLQDEFIEHSAARLLSDNPDIRKHSRITTTSYNHWVLLSGQADTQEISDRFAHLVARLPRVKKVFNEVTIGPRISLARESKDALITSKVKLALTKVDIPGFDTTRVKVVTEASRVFLMGLVYPREGEAAAAKASRVPDVAGVVKLFEYIES